MGTQFIPGHLYEISPTCKDWKGSLWRTFLCTKQMFAMYNVPDKLPDAKKDYCLICIDDGGLWDTNPSRHHQKYIDVTDRLLGEL